MRLKGFLRDYRSMLHDNRADSHAFAFAKEQAGIRGCFQNMPKPLTLAYRGLSPHPSP
jgi:hypothetical protein